MVVASFFDGASVIKCGTSNLVIVRIFQSHNVETPRARVGNASERYYFLGRAITTEME